MADWHCLYGSSERGGHCRCQKKPLLNEAVVDTVMEL
jgi:hypothetical protein